MVKLVRMTTRNEREKALREAGLILGDEAYAGSENLFHIKSESQVTGKNQLQKLFVIYVL